MPSDSVASTFPGFKILEQTPRMLRSLISSATPADLDWQPSPDRWSINMVLAHLADVEVTGFRSRFTAILAEDHPLLPGYDQLALFRSGARFDAIVELSRFEQHRMQTLAWLKAQPASVAARAGRHEELGELSFKQLLNEFAFHDLGHIRQVIELYRSHAFYPNMGVFQNYYRINP